MRTPGHYDALRKTERQVAAEKEFQEAGGVAADHAPTGAETPAPEQKQETSEPMNAYDAALEHESKMVEVAQAMRAEYAYGEGRLVGFGGSADVCVARHRADANE